MEWNEVASYNLGTGLDGLLMMVAGLLAWSGARDWHGHLRGVAVACIGLYICSRGLHWYVAMAPPFNIPHDGSLYAPWSADTRAWLAIPAYLMALTLGAVYATRAWAVSRTLAAAVVVLSIGGYIAGGLTPIVPR